MRRSAQISGALAASLLFGCVTTVAAKDYGPWNPPSKAEDPTGEVNTAFNDGCPIQSPDGLSLYIASNRPGSMPNATGAPSLDIWVARRASPQDGWGAPVNLGPEVNSHADDFCPTPVRGNRLFFVSKRLEPNGDIYVTRQGRSGWEEPVRLDFNANGSAINSPAQEWSPAYYEDEDGREVLYFGSTRSGGQGGQDIYYSVDYGLVRSAEGLNTAADDARPNVHRNGREIVFDSNRPGSTPSPAGTPSPDIWTASRERSSGPWSNVERLGNSINTPAGETRASLSWDGATMVFGSNRPGSEGPAAPGQPLQADVYETRRVHRSPGQATPAPGRTGR